MICLYCKKHIQGQYYFDWAGHSVCLSHINSVVKCASCGQFCDSKAKDIGLSMKVCTHCQKYRIERDEADKIISFVNGVFEGTEIGWVSSWSLKMISAEALYKITKDANVRGLAQANGTEYTIYVYRELSRVAFAQVLAHEMLHVYQYKHHLSPPRAKCEGFCNLGSYVVLDKINNNESIAAIDNLTKSDDPIYGDGFRKMLSIYNKGGWKDCISELKAI